MVCVDIAEHKYTIPCFQLLKQFYGSRIQLIVGDSTKILPKVTEHPQKFGLFHVDGAKHLYETDIQNCLSIAAPHCFFLIDDTNQVVVKEAIQNTLGSRNSKLLKLGLEDEESYCNLRSEVYELYITSDEDFDRNQLLSYKVSTVSKDSLRNSVVNILSSGIFFDKQVDYTDSLSAFFSEIVNIDINSDIDLNLPYAGEEDLELFASLIFFSHWTCRKKLYEVIFINKSNILPFMFLDIVLFSLTPTQILPSSSSFSVSVLRKLEKLDIGIAFNLLYQKVPDLRHFVIKSFEKISFSFGSYQLTPIVFDGLLKNAFYAGVQQLLCLLYFKYLDQYGIQNIASATNVLLVRTFVQMPPAKYKSFIDSLDNKTEIITTLLRLIDSYKSESKVLCSMVDLNQIYKHLCIKDHLDEIGMRMLFNISNQGLLHEAHDGFFENYNLETVPDGKSMEWIVASCTCDYFNLFADTFIHSILDANVESPNVLIHVIDSEANLKSFQPDKVSWPSNVLIIQSILDLTPSQIRVVSSQMRFYDAYRIKQQDFMNSVLIADIDTIYLCNYQEIASLSSDVGLNINDSSSSLPWSNISAGIAFFASNSAIAFHYLVLVNKMLDIERSSGSYVWFTDQLARYVVTSKLLKSSDSHAWLVNLNSLRASGKIYQPSGGDSRGKVNLMAAKKSTKLS